MKSKLLLTLWLIGGVLYAGSTAFLAHAVLGGAGGSSKQTTLAVAAETQCAKDDVAAKDADTATKTAAVAPAKPAPSPRKNAGDHATRTGAPQPSSEAADQNEQDDQLQGADSQADVQPNTMPGEDPGEPGSDTAALDEGQEPPLLGAAKRVRNRRNGPCGRRHGRYAVGARFAVADDLCPAVRLACARDLAPAGLGEVQDANSGAAGRVHLSALGPAMALARGPAMGNAMGKAMAVIWSATALRR